MNNAWGDSYLGYRHNVLIDRPGLYIIYIKLVSFTFQSLKKKWIRSVRHICFLSWMLIFQDKAQKLKDEKALGSVTQYKDILSH